MTEPQLVITTATFCVTGESESVPRSREPMVLPDVVQILTGLGWLDPAAAKALRSERDELAAALEREHLIEKQHLARVHALIAEARCKSREA